MDLGRATQCFMRTRKDRGVRERDLCVQSTRASDESRTGALPLGIGYYERTTPELLHKCCNSRNCIEPHDLYDTMKELSVDGRGHFFPQ